MPVSVDTTVVKAKLTDILIAISGIITAVSTFALVIYTAVLSNYSSKQTEIQNQQLSKIDRSLSQADHLMKDADSQTDSAAIQAKAAVSNNTQSLQMFILQERPYVVFVGLKEDDGFFARSFSIKNVGKTPAFGILTRSRATIIKASMIDDALKRGLDNSMLEDQGESVLGSTFDIPLQLNRVQFYFNHPEYFYDPGGFKDSDVQSVRDGIAVVWTSGIIQYKDIFGAQHRTRFCFYNDRSGLKHQCATNNDMS